MAISRKAHPLAAAYVLETGFSSGTFFLLAGLSVTGAGLAGLTVQGLAQAVPALALLIVVRALRERVDMRMLAIVGAACEAAACVVLAFGTMGTLALNLTVPGGVLFSAAIVLQSAGRQSMITDLLDPATRRASLSSVSVAANVSRLAGTAVAGLLLSTGQAWLWIAGNGVIAAVSVAAMVAARRRLQQPSVQQPSATERPVSPSVPVRLDMAGWLYLVSVFLFALFGMNIQIFAPLLGIADFSGSAAAGGVLVSMHTIGAIGGAYLAGRVRMSLRNTFAGGTALLGVGLLAMMIWPTPWAIYVALVIGGIGRGAALNAAGVAAMTWFDSATARERLLVYYTVAVSASNVVSVPLITMLTSRCGLGAALLACGLGVLLSGTIRMFDLWAPAVTAKLRPAPTSRKERCAPRRMRTALAD